MMSRRRYFPNQLPDYIPESNVEIPTEQWLGHITAIVQKIIDAIPSLSSDGGLYVGSSGIAYMLYLLSNYGPLSQNRNQYLDVAQKIFKRDLKFAAKTKPGVDAVSFILGPAGIYALGAFLGKALQNQAMVNEFVQKYQSLASYCLQPQMLRCGSDELFVGRAGYLCGMLALEKQLGVKVLSKESVDSICNVIVQSGVDYTKRHKSSSPLMYSYYDTEYVGAAHGISSILQVVLCCQTFIESSLQQTKILKATVDWLLTLQDKNGNFVPALDELRHSRPEEDELVHWCHGAPGVVYLFARAYVIWRSPEYLQACLKCGEVTWSKGLLTKGPGICHGVAGSGYVFLLLYRLTGDKKHLHRAHKFAEFLLTDEFQAGAKTPDNRYSLYEGWAGTVCFLMGLLEPEKADFPFFSVF